SEGRALRGCLELYERATARLRRAPPAGEGGAAQAGQWKPTVEDQATMKVARKLAHLYNEEARAALAQRWEEAAPGEAAEVGPAAHSADRVEDLLSRAKRWMLLSGDSGNASRVLVNLSELHVRRAEDGAKGEPSGLFTEGQYRFWLQAIECCEEAAALSGRAVGVREGAYAQLRAG
ncbi:unnamed protein product, partial [Prorocentrum cordatum]